MAHVSISFCHRSGISQLPLALPHCQWLCCHPCTLQAYQVLKRGGLKDDYIIVMMFDDIANNPENPQPGKIINHPQGGDVYAGVPKVRLRKLSFPCNACINESILVRALHLHCPHCTGFAASVAGLCWACCECKELPGSPQGRCRWISRRAWTPWGRQQWQGAGQRTK